ncbi:hypothetical protein ACFLT2_04700 [Acidobacteriota bacterium]
MHNKKKIKIICLIILMGSTTLFAYYTKAHTEVARVALEILKNNDQNGIYSEIYFKKHSDKIQEGAWQEDEGAIGGHDRAFRHYWDPVNNRGCPFFSYFLVMPVLNEGSKAWIPKLSSIRAHSELFADAVHVNSIGMPQLVGSRLYYPGALEWARNGAGSQDLRNWEGAIEAYDYTAKSRAEAYWRLGHVVHLVADMAEPDHTKNVPHAASGFYYPKDLEKISGLLNYLDIPAAVFTAGGSKVSKYLIGKGLERLLNLKSWDEKKKVGFEGFVEDNSHLLFPQIPNVTVLKRNNFDSFFSIMAQTSNEAVENEFEFPLPLGISLYPEVDQAFVLTVDHNLKNYSFFPSIEINDKAECEKFLNLTKKLLNKAVRLNAGIMEHFFDIVNPPPYVRSVEIKQDKEICYYAWWEDIPETKTGRHINENKVVEEEGKVPHEFSYDIVVQRKLYKGKDKEGNDVSGILRADKSARIRIEFGPDPKKFESPPEKIKSAVVKIGEKTIAGRLVDKGAAWEGQFIPTFENGSDSEELQIEISAKDVHNHSPHRSVKPSGDVLYTDKEYKLDSDPELPAKAETTPPYIWKNYWPGKDINHKIKVSGSSYVLFYTTWPSIKYGEFKQVLQPLLKSGFKPESWNSNGPYYEGTIEIIPSSEIENKIKGRYADNSAMAYLLQTWVTGKIDKSKKKPEKKKKKGELSGNELYGVPSSREEFFGVQKFVGQSYLFNDPMGAFASISNCQIQGWPRSLRGAKTWEEAIKQAREVIGETFSTSYGKLNFDTDDSANWVLVGFKLSGSEK